MFRKLNAKHGNERPENFKTQGQKCNLSKKGLKSHKLTRLRPKLNKGKLKCKWSRVGGPFCNKRKNLV